MASAATGASSEHGNYLKRVLWTGTASIIAICLLSAWSPFGITGWIVAIPPLNWLPEKAQLPVLTSVSASLVVIWAAVSIGNNAALAIEEGAYDLPYYLGFIGTLVGLCFAALSLVASPQENATLVPTLIAQNGVALLTTLVGLVARNILKYSKPSDPDLVSQMQDVGRAAREAQDAVAALKNDVEQFTNALGKLSGQMQSLVQVAGAVQPSWGQASQSAGAMAQQVNAAAQATNGLVGTIRGVDAEARRMAQTTAASLQSVQASADALAQRMSSQNGSSREAAYDAPPSSYANPPEATFAFRDVPGADRRPQARAQPRPSPRPQARRAQAPRVETAARPRTIRDRISDWWGGAA